jgi:poly[(R)-3-hydroxyalkanoate] polymerase subunit PhaE
MSKPDEWMNTSMNLYKAWLENLTNLTRPPTPPVNPFMQWTQGFTDSFQNLPTNPLLTMIPWSSYTGIPSDSMKTYTAYQEALMAYNSKLWQTWMDAWANFTQKSPELLRKGAEDPKEMYREWLSTFKATYDKLFRTEEFSRLLANLLDKSLDLRKASDSLLQEFLKKSNIPTRAEIDDLQREIHDLKKSLVQRSTAEKPPAKRRSRK